MNNDNIESISHKKYVFINPKNTPIPNDCFGVHCHRWPISSDAHNDSTTIAANVYGFAYSVKQESPAVFNYDFYRTMDGPSGGWVGAHQKIESLTRVGYTVTIKFYKPKERTQGPASITSWANYIVDGDKVTILGAKEAGFNGEFTIKRLPWVTETDAYSNTHSYYPYTYTSTIYGNTTATTDTYLRSFDWTKLDAVYDTIVTKEKRNILYTFLGSPHWNSAVPLGLRPYDDVCMSAPANMDYYIEFCVALANRYPKILHYEVGNEPAWNYFINPTAVPNDNYSVLVRRLPSQFDCLYIGCTICCNGISPTAKIVSFAISSSGYECTITMDTPITGTLSGYLYPSKYYTRNVVSYTAGDATKNITITLDDASGIHAYSLPNPLVFTISGLFNAIDYPINSIVDIATTTDTYKFKVNTTIPNNIKVVAYESGSIINVINNQYYITRNFGSKTSSIINSQNTITITLSTAGETFASTTDITKYGVISNTSGLAVSFTVTANVNNTTLTIIVPASGTYTITGTVIKGIFIPQEGNKVTNVANSKTSPVSFVMYASNSTYNNGEYCRIDGTNIIDYSTVSNINGNILTLSNNYNLGLISGQVRFWNINDRSFFSESPNRLSELTRITKLAIKSVRPEAKILMQPTSGLVDPSNTDPNFFNVSTGSATKNQSLYAYPSWETSAKGYSYLGNDGTGTRAIDHVDIIAQHTYGHREFSGWLRIKSYLASLGFPDMDVWSTEFGENDIPYVGSTYQAWTGDALTFFQPTWIKSTTTSNIVTIYGADSWGIPKGKWLRDIGGNKIGLITYWGGNTIYLKDNALINYAGQGIVYTNKEKQESVARYMLAPIAAGFKKAFLYDADSGGTMSILDDYYSSKVIGNSVNSIKGKTVVAVEQFDNSCIKIYFTDGSIVDTSNFLVPKPLSEYINNQINYLLEVNVAGDITKDLYAVTPSLWTGTSMERNLRNLLRTVSLTAFNHPTDSAAPMCVAISRRHVISSNSFHPIINSTVVFKDRVIGDYAYNRTYTKTITNGTNIAGTDIWIGYLDSDLPTSIVPMLLFPSNFMNYITTETSEAGLPVYIAEQNKSLSIAKWSKYDNDILINDAITVPADFLGMHFHRWPAADAYVMGTILATSGNTTTLVGNGDFAYQLGSGINARGTKLYNFTTNNLIGIVDQVIDATHLLIYTAVTLLTNTDYNYIIATPNAAFDYSMVRTHDGQGSVWSYIQPSRDVWKWDLFDIVYNTHIANGKQILFTIFGTPMWAAARPYEQISTYGGTAAEPQDMNDYINFISAVATRYKLINHYEIYNEATYTHKTATGKKGEYTISITESFQNSNGIRSGVIVSGEGIAAGAKTVFIDLYSFVVTLDKPNTYDVNGIVQFQEGFTRICSATPVINPTTGVAETYTITIDSPILTSDDQYWDAVNGTTNSGAVGILIWNTDSNTPFKNQIQSANGNIITTTEKITSGFSNVTLYFGGRKFFSGTEEKLAEMTRLTSQVIKAINPSAKILNCPPPNMLQQIGGSGSISMKAALNASAEGFVYNGISGAGTTCKDWVDIIGFHTYGGHSPTDIFKLRKTLNSMGISPNIELWDTEVGDYHSNKTTADAIKSLSLLIFAAAFGGCRRIFFYSYDHYDMGLIKNPLVAAGVAYNFNFIKGKTLKTLDYEEPDGGANKGSMTATFTDNTTITI